MLTLTTVSLVLLGAALGASLGSFGGLVVERLVRGSPWSPGSACTVCGIRLRPGDLVPVLSWLQLRGRCRHCGARIHAALLAVEIAGALAGASIAAALLR